MVNDYETLYNLLLDSIPSTIILLDQDLRVRSANSHFLKKSNQRKVEIVGQKIQAVFPQVFFEEFDLEKEIREVFEYNRPSQERKLIYRAPGVPQSTYFYRVLPFGETGEISHAMVVMDDISQQVQLDREMKQVEDHLSSIVDSASDIITTVDQAGIIQSWNPAAEEISGKTLSDVAGKHFVSLFGAELRNSITQTLNSVAASKVNLMSEWPLVAVSGEVKNISWVCSPLVGSEGRALGLVMTGRDLTKQKKLEQQLIKSQKLTSLGVMAGGIAHQVKNPLAVCSSAAQFLKNGELTRDESVQCAEKIYTSTKKASSIIENLLNFSKPGEEGGREIVGLQELLHETMALVKNQAMVNQVELVEDFLEEPIFLHINRELIQQAVLNVLLNGIEVLQGGGTLTIAIKKMNSFVGIAISDTGPGIPKQIQQKIFDPFFTQASGTGLGLSICHSIIELAGGTIEVESLLGEGATFTIFLPLPG